MFFNIHEDKYNKNNNNQNNQNNNTQEYINPNITYLDSAQVETSDNKNEVDNNVEIKPKKKKSYKIVFILIFLLLLAGGGLYLFKDKIFNGNSESNSSDNKIYSDYRLSGNNLEKFDLYFLQLENEQKNKVYSPLSIKYALSMLNAGANNRTKEQIMAVIGDYATKKYVNSSSMSFANAMFVKDSFRNSIKSTYIDTLNTKYGANIIYDSFSSPEKMNSWVSEKTFKLINDLFDEVTDKDFILVNALAIDMEWENKIQNVQHSWEVEYPHEEYKAAVQSLEEVDYSSLDFSHYSKKAKSVEIGASANKYDIVKDKGEENIRNTVIKEYQKWLDEGKCGGPTENPSAKDYIETYMKEIKSSYNKVSGSTDFYFFDDNEVKVFAKDLKKYNGTTLQYVGVMPKQETLVDYINNVDVNKLNTVIKNIKPIELDSFEEGTITKITGYIPMFKFDYELKMMDDLKKLGITDVFAPNSADLSNLTSNQAYIADAKHKANIEFSNDGIKAAASFSLIGYGGLDCKFDYKYNVPVKTIDLTFNKPYLFFIRDKNSGEIWFSGTVYEPVEYVAKTS